LDIKYITYQNINKQKWDKCIKSSTNHLLYAESWYLDTVCPEKWNALVLNDYEAVMPLPLKSKMGLTYVQQPIWTQQLGVFSTTKLTKELVENFINAVPKKMAMVSLNLNHYNQAKETVQKTNLLLNLKSSFKELQAGFSSNTKRNITKAKKENLTIDFESNNPDEFIHFFKENVQNPLSDFHYSTLAKIVNQSITNKKGFIALVKQENEIIAASFILKTNNRLIYRTGTSNTKGKALKAMFLLVDAIINQYANSSYILDFEGSEIGGVARFYKGFGAINKPYFYYKKYNNKLLQVIKKRK
jgi:hypothetical protein